MKNPDISFTNQWGKTVTFVNPYVYDWKMIRESVTRTATVTLELTFESVIKTNPPRIAADE